MAALMPVRESFGGCSVADGDLISDFELRISDWEKKRGSFRIAEWKKKDVVRRKLWLGHLRSAGLRSVRGSDSDCPSVADTLPFALIRVIRSYFFRRSIR